MGGWGGTTISSSSVTKVVTATASGGGYYVVFVGVDKTAAIREVGVTTASGGRDRVGGVGATDWEGTSRIGGGDRGGTIIVTSAAKVETATTAPSSLTAKFSTVGGGA